MDRKKTYCTITLLLLAALPSFVRAQQTDSLTVRVVDSVSTAPLAWAEVRLYDAEGKLVGTRQAGSTGVVGFNLAPVSDAGMIEEAGVAMYRAYPNPSVGHSVVPFSLNRTATVSVDLHDVVGVGIASVQARMEPGRHAVDVDMPGLPAGTYLVRISIDGAPLGVTTLSNLGGGASGAATLTLLANADLPALSRPVATGKISVQGKSYIVRVSLEGYEDATSSVVVDGPTETTVKLSPVPVPTSVPEFGTEETRRFMVIGSGPDDSLDVPRDLEFHPDRPNELWTVNRAFDGTVIFFDPGTPEQRSEKRMDVYGYHFMEEVAAMAMGANNTFATIQETNNTYNHNYPGNNFMGPTLWPADLNVYAVVNQNNDLLGSHLDMQHETPFGMGIAHDHENVYWVFDGYHGDIVRYDFAQDHGAGHDDHSDGIVRRYSEVQVKRVPDVPSHLILNKESGWLYINDTGNKRILRLDTRSGKVAEALFQEMEPLAEYSRMSGAAFGVLVDKGLKEPSGIALYQGRLFVTDYATGEIIAYTLHGDEIGRIQTGAAGIMGITVGPDGKLWFVDATANTVVRIDP